MDLISSNLSRELFQAPDVKVKVNKIPSKINMEINNNIKT